MTNAAATERPSITLRSSGFVHTPGFIDYIQRVWLDQPTVAIDILCTGWPDIPAWAIHHLLAGKFTVVDDAVVITYSDGEALKLPETHHEASERRKRERDQRREEQEDQEELNNP